MKKIRVYKRKKERSLHMLCLVFQVLFILCLVGLNWNCRLPPRGLDFEFSFFYRIPRPLIVSTDLFNGLKTNYNFQSRRTDSKVLVF